MSKDTKTIISEIESYLEISYSAGALSRVDKDILEGYISQLKKSLDTPIENKEA